MVKVKSISIEGGAANPIADKGLDEALAETTMAATDSIPVKKAGGGFVYLDRDSLVSAICQAFGVPAKNNNIGTALTHILGFNSGNGAGVATLAEAAQVLGDTTIVTHKNFPIDNLFPVVGGSAEGKQYIRLRNDVQDWWIGVGRTGLQGEYDFLVYNAARGTHPLYITANDEVYINGHLMTF